MNVAYINAKYEKVIFIIDGVRHEVDFTETDELRGYEFDKVFIDEWVHDEPINMPYIPGSPIISWVKPEQALRSSPLDVKTYGAYRILEEK